MKTTLDIKDDLLVRAKRLAKKTGRPLRAVVEDGIRAALEVAEEPAVYKLPDLSVGSSEAVDPLESMTWQDLRSEIYGEPAGK
jgi:hypothetical protein